MMPSLLHLEMHPKIFLWPKSFQRCEPSDDSIALYFFPRDPMQRFRESFQEDRRQRFRESFQKKKPTIQGIVPRRRYKRFRTEYGLDRETSTSKETDKRGQAKEIWDSLKSRFIGTEDVQQAHSQQLKSEFERLMMKEDESIDSFAGKMMGIYYKGCYMWINSSSYWIVKLWDDETGYNTQLEKLSESVHNEGLTWGTSKLVPVGYGIKKLQVMMTIVDDLVSIDSVIEDRLTTEPISEYVQSCDIVAFNKIFLYSHLPHLYNSGTIASSVGAPPALDVYLFYF
ncbi:elongation factor 1-beta-like protein [Tanacetum coccineum]